MPRLSTAIKRRKNLGATTQKHRFWKGTIKHKQRMPSFKTEALAKAWAKTEKLDEKTHELRELQKTKWQWRKINPRLV